MQTHIPLAIHSLLIRTEIRWYALRNCRGREEVYLNSKMPRLLMWRLGNLRSTLFRPQHGLLHRTRNLNRDRLVLQGDSTLTTSLIAQIRYQTSSCMAQHRRMPRLTITSWVCWLIWACTRNWNWGGKNVLSRIVRMYVVVIQSIFSHVLVKKLDSVHDAKNSHEQSRHLFFTFSYS